MPGRRHRSALARGRWRTSPWLTRIGLVWLAIVALLLIWQTFAYSGFTATLAEMQYAQFGYQFPGLTLILLLALLGIPGFILVRLRRRPARRDEGPDRTPVEQSVAAERRLLRALMAVAGLAALLAVVMLIVTLFEPRDSGPPRAINADAPPAVIGEGHVTLTGSVLYQRTATFEQDVLFLHRPIRFAPVVRSQDDMVRFFIEVSPERLAQRLRDGQIEIALPTTVTGILKRNALPGPIENLFRYAGFKVATPHYVLMATNTSLRMRKYVIALNAALAAVGLLALGLVQRRRLRQAREVAVRAGHMPI